MKQVTNKFKSDYTCTANETITRVLWWANTSVENMWKKLQPKSNQQRSSTLFTSNEELTLIH